MRRSFLSPLVVLPTLLSAQWVSIAPGGVPEFEAVLVDDAQHFLIAGDASAFSTSDGGASWTPVTGLAEGVRDFLRLDAQVILAASDGVIYRSADNGATWTDMPTPAPDDIHSLARAGNTVIAVGRAGWIGRSDDMGLTWSGQTSGATERLFCTWALSPTNMLAAGDGGTFLRTTNGGTTWTPGTLPESDSWTGLVFFAGSPTIGLLCGEDGTLLRTTDAGTTWNSITTGSAMGLMALATANDSVVYAAGLTGTAIKSNDLGLTWTPMTSPSTNELAGIDVKGGMAVAVGVNGTVMKLGQAGVGMSERTKSSSLMIHPNPSSEQLRIEWTGTMSSSLVAEIIAADGRTLRNEKLAGMQHTFDLKGLSAGTYQLRIRDAEKVLAQRPFVRAQ